MNRRLFFSFFVNKHKSVKTGKTKTVRNFNFGIKPIGSTKSAEYTNMRRIISLKTDLGWKEKNHLQNILAKCDIWADFLYKDLILVSSESYPGKEIQRLDLLYLDSKGNLIPCELKIGEESLDTHGQIIRYIAALDKNKINRNDLDNKYENYLSKINDTSVKMELKTKYDGFCGKHFKRNKYFTVKEKIGLIIDEEFKPQLIDAVKYLNRKCGFKISLIKITAYTTKNWSKGNGSFDLKIILKKVL
jgi:hypothetical protein